MQLVEAGLSVCHPEKNAAKVVSGVQRDTLSGPVRAQESPNCGNLRDFHDNAAGFLCNSDCLAEREGFEPSIQVLARITV
jgi:hypothetical protein